MNFQFSHLATESLKGVYVTEGQRMFSTKNNFLCKEVTTLGISNKNS